MIQLQFYRKGLTKKQIEQILNNYKLKYTTITNEINAKLNYLVKTVINDICPFLENIEEISKEINNLKDLDNHKKKLNYCKLNYMKILSRASTSKQYNFSKKRNINFKRKTNKSQ